MDKQTFEKELAMCRELSRKNGGHCNWGRCTECGVVPLLYKLGEGTLYENADEIQQLKNDVLTKPKTTD